MNKTETSMMFLRAVKLSKFVLNILLHQKQKQYI